MDNNLIHNTHSDTCRYKEEDMLLYAYLELGDNKILISANEVGLFDMYLEKARNKDKEITIDYAESDDEPYQIIYGGLMFNNDKHKLEEILDFAERMKGFAFIALEEDKVVVSGYLDIEIYPSDAVSEGFLPFAALMQTTYRLENMDYSITMFPALKGYYIWENMVNRPFLLACRKGYMKEGVTPENWKEHIVYDEMLEVYKVSDLYIPAE